MVYTEDAARLLVNAGTCEDCVNNIREHYDCLYSRIRSGADVVICGVSPYVKDIIVPLTSRYRCQATIIDILPKDSDFSDARVSARSVRQVRYKFLLTALIICFRSLRPISRPLWRVLSWRCWKAPRTISVFTSLK